MTIGLLATALGVVLSVFALAAYQIQTQPRHLARLTATHRQIAATGQIINQILLPFTQRDTGFHRRQALHIWVRDGYRLALPVPNGTLPPPGSDGELPLISQISLSQQALLRALQDYPSHHDPQAAATVRQAEKRYKAHLIHYAHYLEAALSRKPIHSQTYLILTLLIGMGVLAGYVRWISLPFVKDLSQEAFRLQKLAARLISQADRQTFELATLREQQTINKTLLERFSQLIESAQDIIYEVTYDGAFLYVNRAFHDLLGYSRDDVKVANYMTLIREDYREPLKRYYKETIKAGKTDTFYEFPVTTRSGETLYIQQQGRVYYDKDKRVTKIQFIARDVTNLTQARERQQSTERLLAAVLTSADMGIGAVRCHLLSEGGLAPDTHWIVTNPSLRQILCCQDESPVMDQPHLHDPSGVEFDLRQWVESVMRSGRRARRVLMGSVGGGTRQLILCGTPFPKGIVITLTEYSQSAGEMAGADKAAHEETTPSPSVREDTEKRPGKRLIF